VTVSQSVITVTLSYYEDDDADGVQLQIITHTKTVSITNYYALQLL